MATSKREPPSPRDRNNRMSPTPKPGDPSHGPLKARSVPSSPDRKSPSPSASRSPDLKSSSSSASRPAGSRPTLSSTTPTHGKAQHPTTSSAANPTLTRGKSEKSSSTRPPLLVTPTASFKDFRAPKSPSTLNRARLSPRPRNSEKVASTALRGGRAHATVSPRTPSAVAKKREANGAISKTSRAPEPLETSRIKKEQEEEPSLEFGESENITNPSIEEPLLEQLPDPVDTKAISTTGYSSLKAEQHKQHEQSSEHASENTTTDQENKDEEISEDKQEAKSVQEAKPEGDATVKVIESAQPDVVVERENEVVKGRVETMPAAKRPEVVQGWRKDDPKSNDVIEETRSKLLEERKSKVKALVGAFETVMYFRKSGPESPGGQSQEKGEEGNSRLST